MMGFASSDDYQPLFWVRGRPVHVTSLLVAIHIFSLIAYCLLNGFGLFNPLRMMEFGSLAVLHGQVWRPVTYVFAHEPSIGFLFSMFLLFFLGREVERYFGRKMFAMLYAGLTLAAPLVLLGLHYLPNADGGDAQWIDGGNLVLFGVFIAFVVIYPSVQIYFSIPSIWIAYALLAIATLACFADHRWHLMIVFWTTVAVAYFGTRYASVGSEAFGALGNLRSYLPRRSPPREVSTRLRPRRAIDTPAHVGQAASARTGGTSTGSRGEDVHESIDPLLDKISKHGLSSLTNSERATLERARVSLLRKERGG